MTVSPNVYFRPGDLLLFRGSSRLSRAIRWATRSRGEEATYANHVGGIGQGGSIDGDATNIEALWKAVEHPLRDGRGCEFQAFRLVQVFAPGKPVTLITTSERLRLAAAARGYIGRQYGAGKIVLHLGDALLSKVFGGSPYIFRRLASLDDYPICSWLWAHAYNDALGYTFGCDPDAASPDDMHDWCVGHPDEWERIV